MTEQLKPCPLCGGTAELKGGNETPTDGACWWVQCSDIACFCSIGCHYMSDDGTAAIEAWNRRAQPAQAVPVLTDDPLFVFAQEVIHGAYKPDEIADAAMRAIRHHSAVRAKMGAAVPMTHMQIVTLWGHRSDGPSTPEIVSFARLVERHHGIVGKEGA